MCFIVTVTGSILAPSHREQEVGILLRAEMSSFMASYTISCAARGSRGVCRMPRVVMRSTEEVDSMKSFKSPAKLDMYASASPE